MNKTPPGEPEMIVEVDPYTVTLLEQEFQRRQDREDAEQLAESQHHKPDDPYDPMPLACDAIGELEAIVEEVLRHCDACIERERKKAAQKALARARKAGEASGA